MYASDWPGKGLVNVAYTHQESGDGVSHDVEEEEQIAQQLCSEAYLRRITGDEDLGVVRNLVLIVDSNTTQVTCRQ